MIPSNKKKVIVDSTLPYRAFVLETRNANHKFYMTVLDSRYALITGCKVTFRKSGEYYVLKFISIKRSCELHLLELFIGY